MDSVLTVSQLNATSRQRQRRTRKRNRTKESPQFTVNTQHSEDSTRESRPTFTQHSPAVNRLEDSTRESRPTVLEDSTKESRSTVTPHFPAVNQLEDSTKESRPTVTPHSPTEDGLEDSTDGVANILRRKLKRLELGEVPKKPGVISRWDRDKLLEPTPHSEAGHSSGVVTEQSEEDVSQGSGRPDPLGNTALGKDD